MKLKLFLSFLFAIILTGCASVGGPKPDPIVDQSYHANISTAQAYKTITKTAIKRGWTVHKESANTLIAKLNVRSHSVAVNIILKPSSYDITYHDSENMKYNPETGTIHRKYNGWVGNLNKDIQAAMIGQ